MHSHRRKQRYRKPPKKAGAILAGGALVLIVFFGLGLSNIHALADTPPKMTEVTVEPGDTLWNIAAAYLPAGRDIRDFIDEISASNHLHTPMIYPGQTLKIPVY